MSSPHTALILCAGLATRMRPLTNDCPKCLLHVCGKPILEHILDNILFSSVRRVVINAYYLAYKVIEHVESIRAQYAALEIILIEEKEHLEAGGSIQHALPVLGSDPFFTINGDIIWEDSGLSSLDHMVQLWKPEHMEALMLMCDRNFAVGYSGKGDFKLSSDGEILRPKRFKSLPFVYMGVQIIKPSTITSKAFTSPFHMWDVWKTVMDTKGCIKGFYGTEHLGHWYHIGTPDELTLVEAAIYSS